MRMIPIIQGSREDLRLGGWGVLTIWTGIGAGGSGGPPSPRLRRTVGETTGGGVVILSSSLSSLESSDSSFSRAILTSGWSSRLPFLLANSSLIGWRSSKAYLLWFPLVRCGDNRPFSSQRRRVLGETPRYSEASLMGRNVGIWAAGLGYVFREPTQCPS